MDVIDDIYGGEKEEKQLLDFVDDYADSFFNLEPYPILTNSFPDMTDEDAYNFIDDLNLEMRRCGVGPQVGRKLGFAAAQRPFGVPEHGDECIKVLRDQLETLLVRALRLLTA